LGMIIGYLSSDNKIYTRNGRFIKEFRLEEDEEIIEKDNDFYCGGIAKATRIGGNSVFDKGKCTIIRTNERLILYREIKPREKMSLHPFLGEALIEALRAKELSKLGLKEYIEFQMSEIEKTEKGWLLKGREIDFRFNGDKYYMIFPKSKKNTLEDLFR